MLLQDTGHKSENVLIEYGDGIVTEFTLNKKYKKNYDIHQIKILKQNELNDLFNDVMILQKMSLINGTGMLIM